VLALREEGVPLGEIAVLARAAWHTNALEVALQARNIPFRKFGGIRFVESAHVKDVCALLKIGVNPADAAAWFRVLQLFPGVGPKTAQRIAATVISKGGDASVLADPQYAKRKYAADLKKLRRLLEAVGEKGLSVAARLDHVLHVYTDWMGKKYDDVKRRRRDLDALRALAERYKNVESFLSDLAIDPPDFVRQVGPRLTFVYRFARRAETRLALSFYLKLFQREEEREVDGTLLVAFDADDRLLYHGRSGLPEEDLVDDLGLR